MSSLLHYHIAALQVKIKNSFENRSINLAIEMMHLSFDRNAYLN